MKFDQIVKDISVKGDGDRDTTIIKFNDQAFAFSLERLEEHHARVGERLRFLRTLQKARL